MIRLRCYVSCSIRIRVHTFRLHLLYLLYLTFITDSLNDLRQIKSKTLVVNGLLASLYIAVSLAIQPIAFSNIQFRLPEIFNHLVVFNKKYFFGIVLGVFLTNLFSPLGIYDLVFGVLH